MTELKVGDIVRLKSGSPEMTVIEISTDSVGRITGRIRCSWFAGKKNETAYFPAGALEKADVPTAAKSA